MVAEVEPEMKKALMLLKMNEAECCSENAVNKQEGIDNCFEQVQEAMGCCSEVGATTSYDNLLM